MTNLSPPQFNQLKVTLAMKYLLLFSIVMSLYIKRNPHIQSICWQDMRIEFQGGDSSHEIFFYFSFCSSPLRYLNCRFDAEAKGQSISKCLFGVFNFFNKTNENTSHSSKNEFICSFFGRIHSLTIFFLNQVTFSKLKFSASVGKRSLGNLTKFQLIRSTDTKNRSTNCLNELIFSASNKC